MIEEKHHQHRLELHPKSRKMRGSTYPGQVGVGSGPGQTGSTPKLKIGTDILTGLSSTPLSTSPDVRPKRKTKTEDGNVRCNTSGSISRQTGKNQS